MIWYDMIYDMIWYDIWYDMIWFDLIYDLIWYNTDLQIIRIVLSKKWRTHIHLSIMCMGVSIENSTMTVLHAVEIKQTGLLMPMWFSYFSVSLHSSRCKTQAHWTTTHSQVALWFSVKCYVEYLWTFALDNIFLDTCTADSSCLEWRAHLPWSFSRPRYLILRSIISTGYQRLLLI